MPILFCYISQNVGHKTFDMKNLKNKGKNNKATHWYLKKIVHVLFYVFQTNLNKAVGIFCTLPE